VKKLLAGLLALVPAGALAHPHFNKTITAKLPPGVEVTITYDTTPANEARAEGAKVGEFVTPRRPVLKLGGELKAGKTALAPGEYTIGVIKTSDKDWVMALYPGRLARTDTPDTAKAIRLESKFSSTHGKAEHMLIDLTPGEGTFEGKAVLTLHFGSLHLAGVLADAGGPPPAPAGASTPRKP
jgi:hypothetical protein